MLSYIIEGRVCYLTMCDRAYPKKLAFQYLEDLANEFERVNGSQIETAARPYAFIKFGRSSILRFDFLYMINCHVVLLQVLINFLLSYADRYVHSENKEIVSGHENSAKHCKVE